MNISFDYMVVLMEHKVILNCKAKEYNDMNIMIFGPIIVLGSDCSGDFHL